jgi:hypothetical protein
MKKLQNDSFTPRAGDRSIANMNRAHGLVTGVRSRYNVPNGFTPGKHDDDTKGYGPGSEIMTVDGTTFKCITAPSNQAVWVRIKTEVTEGSYVPEDPTAIKKAVAEPKPEPKKEEEPKTEPTPDVEEKEEEPKETKAPEQTTADLPIDQPKDKPVDVSDKLSDYDNVPFEGYFAKNDITTLSEIKTHAENGTLAELSYFNENRAKKVQEWLNKLV